MSALATDPLGAMAQQYQIPQGIALAGPQAQAIPRTTGAYDTEGLAATTLPTQLVLFQNTTQFGNAGSTLSLGPNKLYGRDTNITSKTGGMALGERLYMYGINAKVDAGGQTLNSAANAVSFDQWRQLWGITDFQFNLGTDEFIRAQMRDIPTYAPKTPFTTIGSLLVEDVSLDGMFDVTIQGAPYVLDQQEDFRVYLNFNQGTTVLTLAVQTYITVRLEGIRLKAIRQ